jgi:hypothetical protein
MRMDRPRGTLSGAVGLGVLVIALAGAARPSSPDVTGHRLVGETLAWYEAIEPAIPAGARVGLIPNTPAFGGGTISAHYLAQFALAPRVVDLDLSQAAVVVSEPAAAPALDHDPRLAAFDLVRIGEAGIRVYRRRE